MNPGKPFLLLRGMFRALALLLGVTGAIDYLRVRLHFNRGRCARPNWMALTPHDRPAGDPAIGARPPDRAMSTAINTDFKELRLALDLLREWRQVFPAVAENLPLYGNAVTDLRNAYPVDPPRVIILALTLYRCDSTHIRNSIGEKVRYYLSGSPAAPADDSARRKARNALRKIERARAARKAQ